MQLFKHIDIFSYTLDKYNNRLVSIATIVLLFSYQILTFTGQKPHYLVFIAICVMLVLANINAYFNYIKFWYLLPLIISAGYFLTKHSVEMPFVLSILNYVVIPFVFLNHNFQEFNLQKLMQPFQWFVVFCFGGLLLQVIGFEAPFLDLEFAITNGEVRERYGSFAGSTLVLGFYASISTIYTYYNIVYFKKKTPINICLLIISLATLFLAQSRRYYFFSIIILALISFYGNNLTFDFFKFKKKNKWMALLIGLLVILSYVFRENFFLFERAYSIFDFEGDGSNVLRAIKWLEAIEQFLNNFWFGAGLGDMGTIGKNLEDNSIVEMAVAESYYLKMFVEGGIIFGIVFIWMMVFLLKKSFKLLRNPQKAFASYVFIFFFLDGFMSMTMEYVLASMLFWIAVAIITKKEQLIEAPLVLEIPKGTLS